MLVDLFELDVPEGTNMMLMLCHINTEDKFSMGDEGELALQLWVFPRAPGLGSSFSRFFFFFVESERSPLFVPGLTAIGRPSFLFILENYKKDNVKLFTFNGSSPNNLPLMEL